MFLSSLPILPLIALIGTIIVIAYQAYQYISYKKKHKKPSLPNIDINKLNPNKKLFKKNPQQAPVKNTSKININTLSNKSAVRIIYYSFIVFFIVVSGIIILTTRNQKFTYTPRANQEPTLPPELQQIQNSLNTSPTLTQVPRVSTQASPPSPSPKISTNTKTKTTLPSPTQINSPTPRIIAKAPTNTPTNTTAPTQIATPTQTSKPKNTQTLNKTPAPTQYSSTNIQASSTPIQIAKANKQGQRKLQPTKTGAIPKTGTIDNALILLGLGSIFVLIGFIF